MHRPCPWLAAGLCALSLSWFLFGCARFQPKPLSAQVSADNLASRTLNDPALRAFSETNLHRKIDSWPLPSWDFTNLVLAAFYYHPDLDVARAKWAVATAGKTTAGERPNPSINVLPAYNTTTLVPSPWIITPLLDIPIETAGKRGYRLAQATHLSEAARLNIASVAWQVRSRVWRSLIELYSAQESEALLRAQQAMQSENVRLLGLQHQAGAISAFELTQARLAADGARLAWRDAERLTAEARVQLADSLGVSVHALDGVQLSFESMLQLPPETSPNEARRQALLHRADILSALAEYEAAQSALQLEIAKQYPDVHLNPGYEFDQGDNKWTVGLTITLPVLNQNRGPIAEANAKRAEAAASFNALQARVLADIDRAAAAYHSALQKRTEADALLANVQKQEKAAQAMLEAGEIAQSDVVTLRLQLSVSALARLDALAKSHLALGQLEDALQSPLGLPATVWQSSPRAAEASATAQ